MDINQILEVCGKVLEIAGPHWPFFAISLILAVVGEVIKGIIFGKKIEKDSLVGWKSLFYQTMILHPIFAGALLGLFLGSVAPSAIATSGLIGTVLYFAFAGFASTGLYRMYKELSPVLVTAMKMAIRVGFKKIGVNTPSLPPSNPEEEVPAEVVEKPEK